MSRTNELGQPIGEDLGDWSPPPAPRATTMAGAFVSVEPLDTAVHTPSLFESLGSADDSIWTYMPWGPFSAADELEASLEEHMALPGWLSFALVVNGTALGYLSYLRIAPATGSIEVGGITLSPALQRTPAATEAQYLLMRNAFQLGYRRYEWKCDALNARSRTAAERLGFTYEGTFRQATHYKGRNRDTAWYSVIDMDWPGLERAFLAWLHPDNFDESGHQRTALARLRERA